MTNISEQRTKTEIGQTLSDMLLSNTTRFIFSFRTER